MSILQGSYSGNGEKSLWLVLILIPIAFSLPVLFLTIEKEISPKIAFTDTGIRVMDSVKGRTFPYQELALDQAEIANLGPSGDLVRVDGVYGLNYCAGWFKSRIEQRVFLLSVNCRPGAEVVRIPSREGYTLLLGDKDPNQLLSTIRSRSTRKAPGK